MTMLFTRFTYDERGQRLMKESYDAVGNVALRAWYLRDAGGGEQCVLVQDYTQTTTSEQLPIGGTRGLGVYERLAQRTLYNLTDHLGNVRVVVSESDLGVTDIAAAQDYYPHGGIMPGRSYTSAIMRNLEYQGMERDGETALLNFELRSMDVRLGRWQAPDPYAQYHSPYLAMGNNPVSRIDPNGGEDQDSEGFDWEQYHQDNKAEAEKWFNSARNNGILGLYSTYDGFSPMGSGEFAFGGFDADGQARDMEAMITPQFRRVTHFDTDQGEPSYSKVKIENRPGRILNRGDSHNIPGPGIEFQQQTDWHELFKPNYTKWFNARFFMQDWVVPNNVESSTSESIAKAMSGFLFDVDWQAELDVNKLAPGYQVELYEIRSNLLNNRGRFVDGNLITRSVNVTEGSWQDIDPSMRFEYSYHPLFPETVVSG